jgi:hypothetical protein
MWEQIGDFSVKYEADNAAFPIRSIAFHKRVSDSSIKVKSLSFTRTYAEDNFCIVCRNTRSINDLKRFLSQDGFDFMAFGKNGICIKNVPIDVIKRCLNNIAAGFDTHISSHIKKELNSVFNTPLIEEVPKPLVYSLQKKRLPTMILDTDNKANSNTLRYTS